MERSPQEKLTAALAREVCQRINDQAVLSGASRVSDRSTWSLLPLRLLRRERTSAQSKAVANDRDGVLKAVDSVAADIRKRLGEPLEIACSASTSLCWRK